jgi:hypothetical protein
MPAKLAFLALAFSLTTGTGTAQPGPKKPDDNQLVTKVYNIKHLIGERGKAGGVADPDAIIKLIFETVPQLRALKPGTDGPQIIERDGGKLEVRATAARQGDIKDLLEALERLQDIAVDLTADVYELDGATYEKLLNALPKPGTGKPPVLYVTGEETEGKDAPEINKALETVNKILKTGRSVQSSSGRFVSGAEATVSARRTVATFANVPDAIGAAGKADNPFFVKEGFGLVALPVVSADRRYVRLKLVEQSTAVIGMRNREFGEVGGKPIVMHTLETEDLGGTGSAVVADGGTVLFRLAYAPKDKVWVVVLKPAIFIQAEEDAQKKVEKKP